MGIITILKGRGGSGKAATTKTGPICTLGHRDTTCLDAQVRFFIYIKYAFSLLINYLQVNYDTTTTTNVQPTGLETQMRLES
jgi:hypothetical protein